MRARWILNLLLLLLVAGLGWAVLRDVREVREASRLTGMDPDRIEGVELVRPGRDTIRLERLTGGGWRMTSPYRIAADPERVGRLIEVVEARVARTFPVDGTDLERLDLAPDPVRISLGGQTLRFGGTEPIERLRYVASGDLVHLTEDIHYHLLTAPACDYVDPSPLPAGLVPASGDIDGEAIDPVTLTAIAAVKADRVEPLNGNLTGQLLRLQPAGDGAPLRFLVSRDGCRWSRPDLRLTYLVSSPPPGLVTQDGVPGAKVGNEPAAATQGATPLPEQAVGLVEGTGPGPEDEQAEVEASVTVPDEPAETPFESGRAGTPEDIVDPYAPMEMRVERLAPPAPGAAGAPSLPAADLDPLDVRQREIDDAVSASFGGPPVRSQAQIHREESGIVDGDAIVPPDQAAGPPPAVKLRPQ